jgi:hypothetical protein
MLMVDAVMALSLSEERRQNGESKSSNFREIFQGTNLVGYQALALLISATILYFGCHPSVRSAVW